MLLVSGSTRAGSTNTAVVRSAGLVAPPAMVCVTYDALATLPAFDPDADRDPLPGPVAALRGALGAASAVLFCTPEYAGTLPGSFKNLLDRAVGGGELDGTPCGWLNVASVAAPRAGAGAHETLATVLSYLGADVVDGACLRAPMTRSAVGPDGLVTDGDVLAALRAGLLALADRVRSRETAPR